MDSLFGISGSATYLISIIYEVYMCGYDNIILVRCERYKNDHFLFSMMQTESEGKRQAEQD